jgi:hypothetical protein
MLIALAQSHNALILIVKITTVRIAYNNLQILIAKEGFNNKTKKRLINLENLLKLV